MNDEIMTHNEVAEWLKIPKFSLSKIELLAILTILVPDRKPPNLHL